MARSFSARSRPFKSRVRVASADDVVIGILPADSSVCARTSATREGATRRRAQAVVVAAHLNLLLEDGKQGHGMAGRRGLPAVWFEVINERVGQAREGDQPAPRGVPLRACDPDPFSDP